MKHRNAFALALGLLVAWACAQLFVPASGVMLAMATVGTTGPGAAPSSAPGDGSGAVEGNLHEAMKIIFEEPLTVSIVSDSELLELFEQDMNVQINQTTGGRYIELAHYFNLPAGVGARKLEGDYIPVPNGPRIRNSQVDLKKIEGTVEMSGDTMRRVKQGEGAFVTWADRALPDLVERVDNELDRMLLGYGAGIKARINDATPVADAELTVDAAVGIAGLAPVWLQFLEGESLVFGPNADGSSLRDASGGGAGSSVRVLDLDPDTETLTLDQTPSNLVDDDYIFAGDDASFSGDDREIMGLLGMIDDGQVLATFQGLVRADYRLWRALRIDGSAAPFSGNVTEVGLDLAYDLVRQRGKGKTTHILMSINAQRNFWELLKNDKRINDPRDYTGGKRKLMMQFADRDIELKSVRKMPDSLVFLVDASTLKHWRNTGWEWDDTTGSIWNRVTDAVGRKDSFYATGCLVMQTGCIAPARNAVIDGLTLPGPA